ncbi:MAG: hypothetical protein EXR07_13095 [Acetobacteraceae bacterium]|nr:hypothetical protein [Acetobacteraceae bacterium]
MPADAVVLDANLLVLFVVGAASRSYIAKHKRLRAYTEKDFTLLLDVLSASPRIVVTPNTLTETSNLLRQIAEPARAHIYAVFQALLADTDEVYVESDRAARHAAFPRLGLTDAALLTVVTAGHVLLTADLDLYLAADRQGQAVINFTHHIEANR